MQFLRGVTEAAAPKIFEDFCQAAELLPFWVNYPPQQRGRAPTGTSIPWGEVGEKPIGANLVRAITLKNPAVVFPGLPLGGDVRFATVNAMVHFDIKLTGPNDNPNEVVASPHQISGDGKYWVGGVKNSSVRVSGKKATMDFQPELPPFYVMGGKTLICLTIFLKAVYTVQSLGNQPLDFLELACVPNGLMLFDGPRYNESIGGLLIPGKDIQGHTKKRTRVRLDSLSGLGAWRCIKIKRDNGRWKAAPRISGSGRSPLQT